MSDRILLTGISAIGYHGVYPEERRGGQRFIVDAVLQADLSLPGRTDALSDATDYSHVAKLIHNHITTDPVDLIERLATRIAEDVLANFPKISAIEVTVHKPDAPVGIAINDIAISMIRTR